MGSLPFFIVEEPSRGEYYVCEVEGEQITHAAMASMRSNSCSFCRHAGVFLATFSALPNSLRETHHHHEHCEGRRANELRPDD